MSTMPCPARIPCRERGTVLVVGLVVLLVMTLLGITSMQNTALEERMAGNILDRHQAFHAAEAGLQLALSFLEDQGEPPVADAAGSENVWPGCGVGDTNCLMRADEAWLEANGKRYDDSVAWSRQVDALPGVAKQPKIVIEERYLPPLNIEFAARGRGIHFYTVSALGYGATDQARVLLQSTIAKVYGW
jgi:type IV pilus assembly protein PilX